MRVKIYLVAISMTAWACGSPVKKKEFKTPESMYGSLFEAVQTQAIFADSKTFVDCVPLGKPEDILAAYEQQKTTPNFSLNEFVKQHFQLPEAHSSNFKTDSSRSITEHINALWPVLTRQPKDDGGTLIPLRKAYIVPGGRFGEVYYWDSYFTMLGLQAAGKEQLIENMVVNFAQLIQDYGHIPNGNRSYYLSRSQPPYFALMAQLLTDMRKDKSVLLDAQPQLQKEYQYWMAVENEEHIKQQKTAKETTQKAYRKAVFVDTDNVLNRYYDEMDTPRPESYREDIETAEKSGRDKKAVYRHLRSGAESGWDYSSRWLKDGKNLTTIHTTDILPVDLNCLLYYLEKTLEEVYAIKGHTHYAESMKNLAEKRKQAINKYFWNAEKGFYFDYDFIEKKQTTVYSLAAVYPLFFKIASPEQAKAVANLLESQFLQAGGLTTTLAQTGEQWDAPNGWAPLQWMAIQGLRNYGYTDLATTIKERWIQNNIRVYKNTGKMVEKYNVYDISLLAGGGEYPVQDGFGWSNGVLLKLMSEK